MTDPSQAANAAAPPRRAGIYVRVSSAQQVEGDSLAAQEEHARAHVERNGWTVVKSTARQASKGRSIAAPS